MLRAALFFILIHFFLSGILSGQVRVTQQKGCRFIVEGLKKPLQSGQKLNLPLNGKTFQVQVVQQKGGQTLFQFVGLSSCPQLMGLTGSDSSRKGSSQRRSARRKNAPKAFQLFLGGGFSALFLNFSDFFERGRLFPLAFKGGFSYSYFFPSFDLNAQMFSSYLMHSDSFALPLDGTGVGNSEEDASSAFQLKKASHLPSLKSATDEGLNLGDIEQVIFGLSGLTLGGSAGFGRSFAPFHVGLSLGGEYFFAPSFSGAILFQSGDQDVFPNSYLRFYHLFFSVPIDYSFQKSWGVKLEPGLIRLSYLYGDSESQLKDVLLTGLGFHFFASLTYSF